MRFYSYNYLLEQIAKFDWWGAAFTIFLVICLIVTMFKYHQGQKETKFRELAIILGLGIIVVISIKITQYRVTQANDNHYRQAVHFIEIISVVCQIVLIKKFRLIINIIKRIFEDKNLKILFSIITKSHYCIKKLSTN